MRGSFSGRTFSLSQKSIRAVKWKPGAVHSGVSGSSEYRLCGYDAPTHPDGNDVKAYKAMEQFVADGKIRSIGLSNWYVEELTEFLPQVDTVPALVQNEIHPYYQENDVIPFIRDLGIVVQGWYPLGGRGHTAELLGDPVISEIAKRTMYLPHRSFCGGTCKRRGSNSRFQ